MSHNRVLAISRIVGPKNVAMKRLDQVYSIVRRGSKKGEIGDMPTVIRVRVRDAKEISKILVLANERHIPVMVPQGRGVVTIDVPLREQPDSIFLNLSRMKWIRLFEEDGYVEVGPSVFQSELNEFLATYGYEYPICVNEVTWGGLVSVNMSGQLVDAYHGKPGDYVLGLQVVLPTGEILETGTRSQRKSAGPDLTRLFIGGQALFGIITNIRLRLVPKPLEKAWGILTFKSAYELAKAVKRLYQEKAPYPRTLEFMDERISAERLQFLGPKAPKGALLMIQTDGESPGEAQWKLERILDTCKKEETLEAKVLGEAEWKLIFDARSIRSGTLALPKQETKKVLITNVFDPPVSVLPEAVKELVKLEDKLSRGYPGLVGVLAGHAGGTTIHPNYYCPPDWDLKRKIRVAKEIKKEILALMLTFGAGAGEQGVFSRHREWFLKTYGKTYCESIKRIKMLFDPNSILNIDRFY